MKPGLFLPGGRRARGGYRFFRLTATHVIGRASTGADYWQFISQTSPGNLGTIVDPLPPVVTVGQTVSVYVGLSGGELNDPVYDNYYGTAGTVTSFRAQVPNFRLLDGGSVYPGVNMTGNALPSPLVASSNGSGGSNAPYKAFDGGSGYWESDTSDSEGSAGALTASRYVQVDLGAGVLIFPDGYRIRAPSGLNNGLEGFVLSASVDGAAFDQLDTKAGLNSGWTANTDRDFAL